MGAQVLSLLLALKVRYPKKITLLRGRWDCRQTTYSSGFYEETFKKFGTADVWWNFYEVFNCLPLAATIDNQV